MNRSTFWGSVVLGLAGILGPGGEGVAGADTTFLEAETEGGFVLAGQLAVEEDGAGGELRLFFHGREEQHGYVAHLTTQQVWLARIVGGQEQPLGPRFPSPLEPGRTYDLTLQRGPWRMRLLLDGAVVAEAVDETWAGGKIGWAAASGFRLADWNLQPTEEVYFTDDFMRAEAEAGEWTVWRGQGAVQGPEDQRIDPQRSANPFCYEARPTPDQPTVAVTGYWFWQDYTVEASVWADGVAAVGLCAYAQDADRMLLFRWTKEARELVWVRDGRETVLARTPGGFAPQQWYRLSLRVVDDVAEARVDGQVVATAAGLKARQGRAGLYAAQPTREGGRARFDDVQVASTEGLAERFASDAVRWTATQGEWRVEEGGYASVGPGPARAMTGPARWSNYVYEVTLTADSAPGAGLCFAARDAQNYFLLRPREAESDPPQTDNLAYELCRVAGGQATVLDRAVVPAPHRLRVTLDRGYVEAVLDDQGRLEAFDPDATAGRVGLYAAGPGVRFASASLWFPTEMSPEPIPVIFAGDELMKSWATDRGAWRQVGREAWLRRGDYWGNCAVEWPVPDLPPRAKMSVLLAADADDWQQSYWLTLLGTDQGPIWRMGRAAEVRAEGPEGTPLQPGTKVRLERQGRFLSAWAAGRLLTAWREDQPLSGSAVVLQGKPQNLALEEVIVRGSQVEDSAFVRAPVDWVAQQGEWTNVQRWTCGPQWSFFGGRSPGLAALWSKARYEGDVTLECYVANQMEAGQDFNGGERTPTDLNVTLCGDGVNLGRGYNFIFAGWGQTFSRLLRGSAVLAEQPFRLGAWEQMLTTHQTWCHLRVQKRGGQLRLFVNDRLVLSATDPDPLPGGHLAFWTVGGGIVIARARVYYEGKGRAEGVPVIRGLRSVPDPNEPPTPGLPTNDFEAGLGTWTTRGRETVEVALDETTARQGHRSLRVTNRTSGGDFTVWLTRQPFDAREFPRWRFDYRLPPEVKVNFYVRLANNQWYEITFTGPGEGIPTRSLGAIPEVQADDQWHTAEFDLLAAIQSLATPPDQTTVQELALSARGERYLRCGIGGNPLGATYHLDDFRLIREQRLRMRTPPELASGDVRSTLRACLKSRPRSGGSP